ncbi:13684_t:CDS:2 [Ambispora leptoticha]|uniref:13684_t:CDS:1 n=1 Tax=Ambispora leptoticha TaxID=144679 RepID=A0A9N9BAU5_9GLOM|nr:13684_t:CDS:2 [Ambispora leptoticha]
MQEHAYELTNSATSLETLYEESSLGGHDDGFCPAVGHSLGGGFGLYSREFGLATNHILLIQMVSTNGTVLTAKNVTNPDLFFALRGAGLVHC